MKNKDIIKVVFRKFKDGEIIALFPNLKFDNAGNICSYMHIGQHGGASPLLVNNTKLATPEEYKPIYNELLQYWGNSMKICKRITRK